MNKTKIDWCDCTVNPVKGCKNGCKYCYARRMNDRFHYVKNWDEPQFFPKALEQFKSKKPRSVFIDSMSDIGCWKDEWLEQVFKAMAKNPQHNYIALTKCYISNLTKKTLQGMFAYGSFHFFIGNSITTREQAETFLLYGRSNDFLSIEPLLEPIETTSILSMTRTVIIGAETGNRKGKVIPKKEWVQDIVNQCVRRGKIVFMKESLRGIMGDEFRQDRLPWEIRR